MKEVKIIGRLGNQLFQFAHAYSEIHNSSEVDKNYCLYFSETIPPIDFNCLKYPPKHIEIGDYGQFIDYFESEKFFDHDLIRGIYTPNNEKIRYFNKKYGDLKNSLFITVRRGDFVTLKESYICCNTKYYNSCYQKITKNGKRYDKIFISSDDLEWCKKNLKFHNGDNIIYLDNEEPFDIIQLASLCKDFIISTSTFSWWCAWMGEKNGGIVICPNKKFIIGKEEKNRIFFPERWQKVESMNGLYEI